MTKRYIVLHHSDSPDHGMLKNFDDIKRWHVENNGWRDIGYHWVIEFVGGKLVALPGRSEWDDAAACPGKNKDGIHICCVGNFEDTIPGDELYLFVADLCKQIMARHPIKEIGGHGDYVATACPGKNFNVNRVRQLVKEESKVGKVACTIDIKGTKFPGYLKGGRSYFDENVAVVDVVKAVSPNVTWDEKTRTVVIK